MERFLIRGTASVIVEREGKILLTREEESVGIILGKPGGHIEEGESFAETAVRETLEETGYRVRLTAIVGVYQQRFPNSSSINVTFVAELEDETPQAVMEKKILEVLWLPIEEVKRRRDEWRPGSTTPALDDYFAGKRYPLELLQWLDHTKTP
jgi:ADP-ribose pyrophosphatase YjhB (NUDIX family)